MQKIAYLPNNHETEPSKKWLEHTVTYKDFDGEIKCAPCCHLIYEKNFCWIASRFGDHFVSQVRLSGQVVKQEFVSKRQSVHFTCDEKSINQAKLMRRRIAK